ncbi:MAG: TetR/AcrR family transcriptional regulator [Deltaproteobacteria bacterium]|nr:TetR/AcrR family transcriptional regulator [Deltaproteobacteria bacterium]
MARPRSDIAPRIVHAARARFLVEGVDGASLRTIARDANTSVGMIYYYFPTKDDLFLEVVEEVYAALLRELEQVLTTEHDTKERLRRMYVRLGALSDLELDVVRLVVREALLSSTRLERVMARFARGHLPLILATLAQGVAAGEIVDDVPLPILMFSTFALGIAPQIMRRVAAERMPAFAAFPAGEPLANQLLEVLFRGIGKRA